MLQMILGILAGMCLPVQISANTKLKKNLGSPFYASYFSFLEAWVFLVLLMILTEQDAAIPFAALSGEPAWVYAGGICGVIFMTGTVLLFPKLGGIRTVVLPVLGQILMGLIIDTFGLLRSPAKPLTVIRTAGAALVFAGVVMVSLAKNAPADGAAKPRDRGAGVWVYSIFGVLAGMLSATQTAANGYLGKVVASPVKASVISFTMGSLLLTLICAGIFIARRKAMPAKGQEVPAPEKKRLSVKPLWMWTGGFLGAGFILGNIYLSRLLGTGMTVIFGLTGTTAGGLLIDHFGLMESPVRKITFQKVMGIVLMLAGAVMIRLL